MLNLFLLIIVLKISNCELILSYEVTNVYNLAQNVETLDI